MASYKLTCHGGSQLGKCIAGMAKCHGGSRCGKAIVFNGLSLDGDAKIDELHCLRNTQTDFQWGATSANIGKRFNHSEDDLIAMARATAGLPTKANATEAPAKPKAKAK